MSLALLSVGRGQLAPPTLHFSDTPPSLLACSWEPAGGRLCGSTLMLKPRLSFLKVCKQGLHLDEHLGRKMGLRVGREGHMSL